MFGYVALTWNANDIEGDASKAAANLRQQLRALQDFQVVLSVPGLHIVQKAGLGSACSAIALPDNGGAILGTLFSTPGNSESAQRVQALTQSESKKITESQGLHLTTHYWGRYVAFVRLKQTHRYLVLRDPSGMLPCYRRAHHGVQIWFSRLEDLSALGLPEASINWQFIERHVASGLIRTHETGLCGIEQLPAGERCDAEGDEVKCVKLWDPAVISNTDVIEDPRVAADTLRSVTKACIDAWAGSYDGALLVLSGGLDSSIVAGLLGQTPTRTPVTCVNYYTADPEGDERVYARAVVAKAGFELIEKQRTPRSVDLRSILDISRTPSPWFYNYYIEHGDYEIEQAQRHGAHAIFTGGGGDGLFYKAETGLSVADYVQRHGITKRLPAVALNAARLEGKSFSSVLWHAFSDRRVASRRREAIVYSQLQTLLSAATLASQADFIASRFDNPHRHQVPPGKWSQILTTSVPPAFYDQFNHPGALERTPPLVSQPIAEVCLRIPTYLLVENGWDRSMARRAFAADLPPAIVNRRGKGSMQNHMRTIFNTNLKFIREFMLDGELARRGILNRERMESVLAGRQSLAGMEFTEIQDHLSTEAWVGRHVGQRTGMAA
jgi:asparagine synthase (glutamine-hydrolysing)